MGKPSQSRLAKFGEKGEKGKSKKKSGDMFYLTEHAGYSACIH
jgi:hypothetical protein